MTFARKALPIVLMLVVGAWTAEALADPPRHAPAHGWRKKHDPYYVGYYGGQWERDFDILTGHCNREAVATVLGGVIGGVIGNKVADREDRVVATVIGAVAGALIGKKIGEKLDEADRSCVGHSLEVGKPGQVVQWTNETTGVDYRMTLGDDRRRGDAQCREYTLAAVAGSNKSTEQHVACQSDPGVWRIAD